MDRVVTRPSSAAPAAEILNRAGGKLAAAQSGEWFEKRSPHNGQVISRAARSREADVGAAVGVARSAFASWSATPPVRRGEVLRAVCAGLRNRRDELGQAVARETGKSLSNAVGEVDGAILLGEFFAGEGQRLFGRSMTSGTPYRHNYTVREPIGVAGLIVPANTPIANVAWKVFPALICGNTAVLKSAEDSPETAALFGAIADELGLPPGVLNVVHGLGAEAGAALVAHRDVGVLSFTGSTAVGRQIVTVAGQRLARVSLELGGKNPFVVCDDADLEFAAKWAALSAFSNAGQRCAAGSRIIVFDQVYERFRTMLVARAEASKIGPADGDDFGPVINERQLANVLRVIEDARRKGATVVTGGCRLTDAAHRDGYYLAATLVEGAAADSVISCSEVFGPVATLYRVGGFEEALALANASPYGLTACIHTANVHRAMEFTRRVAAGVAVVNAGTYGSEPHMPFGGVKDSGNGTREPGTEALDVYSSLKNVVFVSDPGRV
jgi:alpha-ketoglutaric semialdehyde dehydrogenase